MKVDIEAWIEEDPENRAFRQAVHTVCKAISMSDGLQSNMIMKGGALLALGYRSQRYTRDIDFSTGIVLARFDKEDFERELEEGLIKAVETLEYSLDCRVQRIEQRPARDDASFPTFRINIGYAYKSNANAHRRLMRGMSPQIVRIDYSLNEPIDHVDFIEFGDGSKISVYRMEDLIAEKYRAILQQKIRKRIRGQDLFDLYYILDVCTHIQDEDLKERVLQSLIKKSKARDLIASPESMSDPDIRNRTQKGYGALSSSVDFELDDFDLVYKRIEDFYVSLPWDRYSAP